MQDKTDPSNPPDEAPIDVEDLRPHVFDGIQEYDKRLPNWWLTTLYGAIVYSIGYWIVVHVLGVGAEPGAALTAQMLQAKIEAVKNSPELSDAKLWAMSQDMAITSSGKQVFDTTCASCHRPDLMGQIGPNLRDQQWVFGGQPLTVINTITQGSLAKGMPAWGAILGPTKISQVTAYILSYHKEGEPAEIKPWVPVMGSPATSQ